MRKISAHAGSFSTSLLLASALWCAVADAQMLVHFDLPAQPLAQSLKAIGIATNTDVGFNASQVAGRLAPPLKADLTVDGALVRVLVGTGLRPQHLDGHTIVIAALDTSTADSAETKLLLSKTSGAVEQSADIPHTMILINGSLPQILAQTDTSLTDNGTNANGQDNRTPDAQLEEIVVTGTHIRGIENKTNPVMIIDRMQIDRSGYSSTQDLFRALPQNFASGDASADGIFSANANAGRNSEIASGINLRGLGVSSTLVLLNGHRLAPSVFGSVVDISLIPLAAIDRIEILTDGSSAIYGSDAVGGVVNIILKSDYQGADTSVRYGSVTEGHRGEQTAAQTLGSRWSGGNVVATLQYQKQDSLSAADRDFSADLPLPNDLLPQNKSYAATLDGRQAFSDALEFHGDLLLSKREFKRGSSFDEGAGIGDYVSRVNGDTSNVNVTPGLRYTFSPQWSIDLNGLYGRLQSNTTTASVDPFGGAPTYVDKNEFTEKSLELIANGRWHASVAGDIGIAVGGDYRHEGASASDLLEGGTAATSQWDRHVTALFGEIYVPLIGSANDISLVKALEISAAARRDAYSDFGSTTNPRFGLHWSPTKDIAVRTSFGKSFRAPNAAEELSERPSGQLIVASPGFTSPTGMGTVPALVLEGSTKLQAERARTKDVSIEYKPTSLPGLSATLAYYDILYSNRITTPSFDINALQEPDVYGQLISPISSDAAAQAIVSAAETAGAQYYDLTGGTGVAGIRYLIDLRQANAATVKQSGFDFTSRSIVPLGSYTLSSQLNLTFIDKIDTQYTQGASFSNLVNTFANPTRWRGRLDAAWSSESWSIGGALNSVGSYVNTAALGHPMVASWTTVDLTGRVDLGAMSPSNAMKGFSLSLAVLNALDRNPPYVSAIGLGVIVNYDATNANPLGRFVTLGLRKVW
jgi:iron complex outermembrane receptor protein